MSRTKRNENDINLIKGGQSFYLTLILCLVVFLTAIALLIAAFNRLISRHDQKLSGEICTLMSEKMNSSIDFMTTSTRGMASVLSAQHFSTPGEIYESLKETKNVDYLSVGFVDAFCNVYASSAERDEFDKWKLLETAVAADPVSMSTPYRSSVFGQPVITLFADFEYGQHQRGYMFTTYLLKDLQEIAVTESLGDEIEIWLMEAGSANTIQCAGSDEHATGSWTNAYLTMQNVNKGDREIFVEWLDRVRDLEDNIGITYSIGDTFYSQYSSKIASLPGWYVVVRIPGNALSATMSTFRTYILLFLAVLLLVVIVLIANMYRLSKRDNDMLNSLSIHDPLTGALNRRAFDIAAEKWLGRGRDCALIFFDIDYFKQVNDQFGHDAGDKLLVAFSDTLRKNFSDQGIISRFGGDEFVVLTDMDSLESVTRLLELTTDDVHSIDLNDEKHAGKGFMITFSAGAARFPADAGLLPDLKKCADTALYEAKENGRNGYLWYHSIFEAKKKIVRKVIKKKVIKRVVKKTPDAGQPEPQKTEAV
ncbi:MAG: GGDEF domain-containing protein [Lachnospiraceae bacterium]|nr:GGDEF domain-containing protein [Lachnospiraceae bacterium]